MIRYTIPAALLVVLAACGSGRYVENDEYNDPRNQGGERGSILGENGLTLFSTSTNRAEGQGAGALGVNAFLWRGTHEQVLDLLALGMLFGDAAAGRLLQCVRDAGHPLAGWFVDLLGRRI